MARDSAFFQQFAKQSIVKSGVQKSEGMKETVQPCNERVERTRRVRKRGEQRGVCGGGEARVGGLLCTHYGKHANGANHGKAVGTRWWHSSSPPCPSTSTVVHGAAYVLTSNVSVENHGVDHGSVRFANEPKDVHAGTSYVEVGVSQEFDDRVGDVMG